MAKENCRFILKSKIKRLEKERNTALSDRDTWQRLCIKKQQYIYTLELIAKWSKEVRIQENDPMCDINDLTSAKQHLDYALTLKVDD